MAGRIGYLISQYPTLSHSFLFREVRGLRALGLDVRVASVIRPPANVSGLSEEEKQEIARTYYVRAAAGTWIKAHTRVLFSRPLAYLDGLALAFASSGWNGLRLLRHLRFFGEAIVVGAWLRKNSLAHVHTHFASATAWFAQRVFGLTISMTIHGSDEFIDPAGFCMSGKVAASRLVIAISRYGYSQILRFSQPDDWDRVKIVRLGINPADFEPGPAPPEDAAFQLISVGRIVPVKAHRFLIRACARLLSQGRALHLTLVGDGPERSPLEKLVNDLGISEAVTFTGAVENRAVRDLVRRSHCFVISSFAEGIPVAMMEAMALEVACIGTNVMGIPELIEHGSNGLLVLPAHDESLSAAIERFIDDPQFRRSCALNGRRKILAEFDLDVNVATLSELFVPLLAEE